MQVGDPVDLDRGSSFSTIKDVSIGRGLDLVRYFNSNPEAWTVDSAVLGMPAPFGLSPSNSSSLEWWHGYFSFVTVSGGTHSVRGRDGRLLRFDSCVAGCVPTLGNASIEERLEKTGAAFALTESDGTVLLYEAVFLDGNYSRYLLSEIRGPSGSLDAQVSYGDPGQGCPLGAPGTTPGAPYIDRIVTPEATLSFTYAAFPSSNGTECVIRSVRRFVNSGYSALVTYEYERDANGNELPGRIAKATWASGREETYSYTSGAFATALNTFTTSLHQYSSGRVTTDTSLGSELQISYSTTGQCRPGSDCCGRLPRERTVAEQVAGLGTGNSGFSDLTTRYAVLDNFRQKLEPRLYEVEHSCAQNPNSCSPGTLRYEWTCSTDGGIGYERARKDKRDGWEVYAWTSAATDAGVTRPVLERTAVLRGATDMNGTGALSAEYYSYAYGAHEAQLLLSERRDSVVNPPQEARTLYQHDSTNRLSGIIRTGWSRELDGSMTNELFVGTFYRNRYDFDGTPEGGADPYNRTLQVDGPCFVASDSATACTGTYPVTRFEYWPDDGSLNANRLRYVRTYPNGGSGNVLTTEYGPYDLHGNPIEVTDPNGVSTYLSYQDGRVSSRMVDPLGPVTNFSYENDQLVAVQYPKGNYEVFCYRDGATANCTGAWTGLLQWKAKATSATGSDWSEKVTYKYWPDGTVKSETYSIPCTGCADPVLGEIRRIENYAVDAHRRPTFAKSGTGANGAERRAYDANDNLRALGSAFNAAPAYCLTTTGESAKECRWFEHDRLDRLAIADGYASPSATAGDRTCFDYDAHGNIKRVSAGCATADMCPINVISGMVSNCSAAPANYVYDDFGNLISAELPWTGTATAAGKTRWTHDARGNPLTMQTAAMRVAGEWHANAYDQLGRLLSTTREDATSADLLFAFGYDDELKTDETCPELQHTIGRQLYRDDSFGRTWFSYDAEGRVTAEIRQRAFEPANPACDGSPRTNPHTLYWYDSNGNLAKIRYPHGRIVQYVHSDVDRVVKVRVRTDAAPGNPEREVYDIYWEPYAGLRGYRLLDANSEYQLLVEYMMGGDAEASAELDCTATYEPSLAPSDASGRLRGIWVSSAAGPTKGDLLRRLYRWTGEHVAESQTCVLDDEKSSGRSYIFDGLAGLVAESSNVGAAAFERSFDYSRRRNRVGERVDSCNFSLNYDTGRRADLLLERSASTCGSSLIDHVYEYDRDGRMETHRWAAGTFELGFGYGAGTGGLGAVYSSLKTPGGEYEYYYDALQRRRLKVNPHGTTDEYFYSVQNELLTDQGNPALKGGEVLVEDDYVWLDGRPILMVRDNYDGSTGEVVTPKECGRNDEPGTCGVFAIITDHLRAPIAMFDLNNPEPRLTEYATYDAFGHINRLPTIASTPQPYPTNVDMSLDEQNVLIDGEKEIDFRVLLHVFEAAESDFAYLHDPNSPGDSVRLYGTSGGGEGRVWSPWLRGTSGTVQLGFKAGSTGTSQMGVSAEAFEYRRHATGAEPMFTPLRFPGHYYDAESDLHNNWNRYYDPGIGRYLQPEPLLQDPEYVKSMALGGHSVPAYAYANNNPLNFVDPDGERVRVSSDRNDYWHKMMDAHALLAGCSAISNWFKKCAGEDPFSSKSLYNVVFERNKLGCFLTKSNDRPWDGYTVGPNSYICEKSFEKPSVSESTGPNSAEVGATIAHELAHQMNWRTNHFLQSDGHPCSAKAIENLARCVINKGCGSCGDCN